MLTFNALLETFEATAEKIGWTCVLVTSDLAQQLVPGNRKSFRVRGKIDNMPIHSVALLPIGEGDFVLPVNGQMRRALGKKRGDTVQLSLQVDNSLPEPSPAFKLCLVEDPEALQTFNSLKQSQRNYYIKWVDGVKKEEAVAKRIAQALDALSKGMDFVAMMQYHKTLPK